jgi:2,5-diamino-6-(ribosylamino)-4(3H)-pyrimidinone 5'-phosphate reductase
MTQWIQRQFFAVRVTVTTLFMLWLNVIVICKPVCVLSATDSTEAKIFDILNQAKSWQMSYHAKNVTRPFVTVTFAQSIDGFMAPYKKKVFNDDVSTTTSNYPLSSDDSLLLTHALRSIHDGILIGGRTLSIDNPRLTNRLWQTSLDTGQIIASQQPRPVVLDTNLRHIRILGPDVNLKNPIVCCSRNAKLLSSDMNLPKGVCILPCRSNPDGSLNINDILKQLHRSYGIQSVMIEGGVATLSSFFKANTVDGLVVTIAPKILNSGIAPTFGCGLNNPMRSFDDIVDLTKMSARFILLGQDAIVVSRYGNYVC